MKMWYLSRTILTNVAIIGLAYWFDQSTFYVDPLWFVWIIALVNILLRVLTHQPVVLRRKRHLKSV